VVYRAADDRKAHDVDARATARNKFLFEAILVVV
jgi:hypothetical protein